MVDCERYIGAARLADRLAVVEGFGERQEFEVLLHAVRDPVEKLCPFGRRYPGPRVLSLVSCVERQFDIPFCRLGDVHQPVAIDRAVIGEISPFYRSDPFAADEIAIARGQVSL